MAVAVDPRVQIAFTAHPKDIDDADSFKRPDGVIGLTDDKQQQWGVLKETEGVDFIPEDSPTAIVSEQLVLAGMLPVVVTGCANGTIMGTLAHIGSGETPGLAFRATGGDSFLFFGQSGGTYYLLKVTGLHDYETINSAVVTPADGDVLKVVLLGKSVKCYVNDVLAIDEIVNYNVTKNLTGFVILGNDTIGTSRFTDFSVALDWVDVTDRVDVRTNGLAISRGRKKDDTAFSTGTMKFVLYNGDRRYDPSNPDSPYAGYLLPRRRVRAFVNIDVGCINLTDPENPGSPGDIVVNNDGGVLDPDDHLDIRLNIAVDDWSIDQTLFSHGGLGGDGWTVYIEDGVLKFQVRAADTTLKVFACTDTQAVAFTPGRRAWLRIVYITDNGLGVSQTFFYVTTDQAFDDANVEYGRPHGDVVVAGPPSNNDLVYPASMQWEGKVFWIAVYRNGVLVSKLSIKDGATDIVGPAWTLEAGTDERVITVVVARDRFNGYVDRWPQTVTVGTDAVVQVSCFDYRGVLAQIDSPNSPWEGLYRASEPNAWWRLNDPPMSVSVADSSGHQHDGAVIHPDQVPPPVVFGADPLNRWDGTSKSMNVNGKGWVQAGYTPQDLTPGITIAWLFSTGVDNDGMSHPMLSAQAAGGDIGFTATILDYAGGMLTATFFQGGDFSQPMDQAVRNPTLRFMTLRSGYYEPAQRSLSIGRTYQDLTPHLAIVCYKPPPLADGAGRVAFMRVDGELVAAENVYQSLVLNWSTDITDYDHWPNTMKGRWFMGAPGYRNNVQQAPFSGFLADVGIWERVLEDEEIAGLEAAFKRPWYADDTGTRLNRILDMTGTPQWIRSIDAGSAIFTEQDSFGDNQKVLNTLDDVVATDRGGLYATVEGALRFRERHGSQRDPHIRPHYNFSDRPVADVETILYTQATPTLGDDGIVNVAKVSRKDGANIIRTDEASRDIFLDWSKTEQVGNALDDESVVIADWMIATKAYPRPGFDKVTIKPLYSEEAVFAALDIDLEHAVRVYAHPPGWDGDEETANVAVCAVQGYDELFAIGIWQVAYNTVAIDTTDYLICDDAPANPDAVIGF